MPATAPPSAAAPVPAGPPSRPGVARDWHLAALGPVDAADGPDGWRARGLTDAQGEVVRDEVGFDDYAPSLTETLARTRDDATLARVRLLAVAGGADDPTPDPARVLGYATADLPLRDNTRVAAVAVGVRPAARGRGLGTALHGALVERLRAAGRTVLMASTDHRDEPAPGPGTLGALSGTGRVRADAAGVRFAVRHGYGLEQVARYSALDLPAPAGHVEGLHAQAAAVAGEAYRVHAWDGPAPDRWLEDLAALFTRMSTDDPSAGFLLEEERWDPARVRRAEERLARAGRSLRTVAAEHVATGHLVAFTEITTRHDAPVAEQEDTLVLGEHRGRRLGMLVKTAQLLALPAARPHVRRIGTWNAEENGPMLAINVALGFRPAAASGEWQLVLDEPDEHDEHDGDVGDIEVAGTGRDAAGDA
ncbi:GNAT family N-acetyltransferase [Cellulomonas endophytica]|uniref:GNAT family N-acetyltransferase n=1 Tax=Cellulomonas endophytica TaxID=2494735 RepID=UPI0010110FAF|nr:GNAT family N-acetyltransferase [Cellulomonas endophytica]